MTTDMVDYIPSTNRLMDHFTKNDGTILDMYSENPNATDSYNYSTNSQRCGNYSTEGDCYNREHIIPQSTF
jgi:hypothetical protein